MELKRKILRGTTFVLAAMTVGFSAFIYGKPQVQDLPSVIPSGPKVHTAIRKYANRLMDETICTDPKDNSILLVRDKKLTRLENHSKLFVEEALVEVSVIKFETTDQFSEVIVSTPRISIFLPVPVCTEK